MERLASTLRHARADIEDACRNEPQRLLVEPILQALRDAEAGLFERGAPAISTPSPAAHRILELEQRLRDNDEFLSMLGHELRNPLSPLFMQAQYLLDVARKSESGVVATDWLLPRLGKLCERLQKFLQTLDRILDVSRVSAGRLPLEFEQVNLSEFVLEICSSLEHEAELAQSQFELEVAPNVTGQWDSLRLEHICRNLLSNALRYGAGKPIRVRLSADEVQCRLAVEDHGIGIADGDQGRIFRRFERAVHQRHSGGFGVGLWIVQESCRAMGGKVEVQSKLGSGSTFTVTLPRRRRGSDA